MTAAPRFVLAPDVEMHEADTLPAATRPRDGIVLHRTHGRSPACLVDARVGPVLTRFRRPCTLPQALARPGRGAAGNDALRRDASEIIPVLARLIVRGYLVPADGREARPLVPTLHPGDRAGACTVRRCVRLLDDGEVYEARDDDGARLALKVARASQRDATARLTREAATLERLGGAPAPAYRGAGTAAGRRWLAMEWCPGVPSSRHAESLRTLPPREWRARIAALCAAVADAYAALHARGVLHGDVHAGNVLVTADGVVTLVDFGHAESLGASAPRPRTWFAEHVEPEQAAAFLAGRDAAVSAAGEQYAIATLLYRLVTGRPYLALRPELRRALEQVTTEPPRTFAAARLDWPAMERVLARALAKQPGDRFPDVAGFAESLGTVARGERPPSVARPRPGRAARDALGGASGATFDGAAPPPLASCTPLRAHAAAAHACRRLAVLGEDAAMLAAAQRWAAASARDAFGAYVRACVADSACDARALFDAADALADTLAAALRMAPARAAWHLLAAARVRALLPPRAPVTQRLTVAAARLASAAVPNDSLAACEAVLARLAWHDAARSAAPTRLWRLAERLLARVDPGAACVNALGIVTHLAAAAVHEIPYAADVGLRAAAALRARLAAPWDPRHTAVAFHALLRAYRAFDEAAGLRAAARLAARAAGADRLLLAAELERPERARAPLLEPDGWRPVSR